MLNRYWRVDRINSYLMGQNYQHISIPQIEHPLKTERVWQIWCEIVTASICHQANFDKLRFRITDIATNDLNLLKPTSLSSMSISTFKDLFSSGFDKERLRAAERTKILQGLGQKLHAWPHQSDLGWINAQEVKLSGKNGLYFWLDTIDVFSQDPIRKKARILIHQLLRYGLIVVSDPENVRPAIDYHLMRLYNRTKRVIPVSPEVFDRITNGETARVEFITHLRRAVEEAMWYTAAGAMLRMDMLNHIEWQIARSFCIRKNVRCFLPPLPEKPIDEEIAKLSNGVGGSCPLVEHCGAVKDPRFMKIIDPKSVKPYY